MKKLILFSAIALFLSAMGGCEKEEKLLPATQKGANTIGYKENGVVQNFSGWWDSKSFFHLVDGVSANIYNGEVHIYAHSADDKRRDGLVIFFKFDGKTGVYKNIENVVPNSNSYVKVTRFSNGIISGTFEITKSYAKYTNGRFDININSK